MLVNANITDKLQDLIRTLKEYYSKMTILERYQSMQTSQKHYKPLQEQHSDNIRDKITILQGY